MILEVFNHYVSFTVDNDDYNLNMMEITIPRSTSTPTDGTHCVNVSAQVDDLLEGDHGFSISIASTNYPDNVFTSPATVTVTIIDQDG